MLDVIGRQSVLPADLNNRIDELVEDGKDDALASRQEMIDHPFAALLAFEHAPCHQIIEQASDAFAGKIKLSCHIRGRGSVAMADFPGEDAEFLDGLYGAEITIMNLLLGSEKLDPAFQKGQTFRRLRGLFVKFLGH